MVLLPDSLTLLLFLYFMKIQIVFGKHFKNQPSGQPTVYPTTSIPTRHPTTFPPTTATPSFQPTSKNSIYPTSNPSILGVPRNIHTHLADVRIRVIGDEIEGNIPIIAIPGANPKLQNEWNMMANYITSSKELDRNYVFYILDTHKNREARREIIPLLYDAIMKNTLTPGKMILAGKSVGSSIVTTFTMLYPELISKLILVSPVMNPAMIKESFAVILQYPIDVFIGFARDDRKIPLFYDALWNDILFINITTANATLVDSSSHNSTQVDIVEIPEYTLNSTYNTNSNDAIFVHATSLKSMQVSRDTWPSKHKLIDKGCLHSLCVTDIGGHTIAQEYLLPIRMFLNYIFT